MFSSLKSSTFNFYSTCHKYITYCSGALLLHRHLFLCALLKNQTDQLYILRFKVFCTYWFIKANQYELHKQLKING